MGRFLDFSHYNSYKGNVMRFSSQDRVLIISPHPDDAVLSSGGLIQKAEEAGAKIKIIYITYGSHNETSIIKENKLKLLTPLGAFQLGEKRYNEALKAMNILGVDKRNIVFLGFPDFGTLKMWTDYFKNKSYFSGLTLHNKVFYKTAMDPGTPFQGESELLVLEKLINDFSPTKIIYPSLLDLNSDHRATGLFVRAALSDLKDTVHARSYAYLVHSKNWPHPYGYFPDSSFDFPNYINGLSSQGLYVVNLSKEEESFKKEAIEAHASQVLSNRDFMYSFIKNNELFFSPLVYHFNDYLPLWKPKVLQEINIIPYIKSVVLTSDSQYVRYHIKFYSGIPLYTKINLFIYEKDKGDVFSSSSRYRFIIGRSLINNKIYYKIQKNDDFINFENDDFMMNSHDDMLTIKINKKYVKPASSFFSSLEIEKGDIRVTETPWWTIGLSDNN